jgi:molybdenum cofactor guanylyltransferase
MKARDEHAADSRFTHAATIKRSGDLLIFAIMSKVWSSATSRGITAAILAGGRASRFGGADKSALVVSGARIIDRALAALSPIASEILIVGDQRDRYAGLGIPVVADLVAGAGPLGGIYTALVSARHPWVLVVACDMPFVSTMLFDALVEAIDDAVDAVAPRSARGLEPLCAVYAQRAAPVLRRRVDAGRLRLGEMLAELRVREIAGATLSALDDDGRLFENVNTPHDYARAREVKQER